MKTFFTIVAVLCFCAVAGDCQGQPTVITWNNEIDGSPPYNVYKTGGDFITVSFDYQVINSDSDTMAYQYIVVGLDGEPYESIYSGTPGRCPGKTITGNSVGFNLPDPTTDTVYGVYVWMAPATSETLAFQNYRDHWGDPRWQGGAIGCVHVSPSGAELTRDYAGGTWTGAGTPIVGTWNNRIDWSLPHAVYKDAGDHITVSFDYQVMNGDSGAGAKEYVIVGLDGEPYEVIYSGVPGVWPGQVITGNSVGFNLPSLPTQWRYGVYIWICPGTSQSECFQNYRDHWGDPRWQGGAIGYVYIGDDCSLPVESLTWGKIKSLYMTRD